MKQHCHHQLAGKGSSRSLTNIYCRICVQYNRFGTSLTSIFLRFRPALGMLANCSNLYLNNFFFGFTVYTICRTGVLRFYGDYQYPVCNMRRSYHLVKNHYLNLSKHVCASFLVSAANLLSTLLRNFRNSKFDEISLAWSQGRFFGTVPI